jgi:membrane-associated protein
MNFTQILNPDFILTTFGVVGLFAIIFAESGLFFGFFFPGDSLLFTAGFLAPILNINIYFLIAGVFVAAVLGDNTGYWFGKKVGQKLFTREDSLFFKKENVLKAHEFFNKYGAKALVLARFIPIVRTFVPIIAGVGLMKYRDFLMWNILGAFLWGVGVTSAGYFLGRTIPNAEHYLSYIIAVIIVVSFIPVLLEIWKGYKKH